MQVNLYKLIDYYFWSGPIKNDFNGGLSFVLLVDIYVENQRFINSIKIQIQIFSKLYYQGYDVVVLKLIDTSKSLFNLYLEKILLFQVQDQELIDH